MILSIIAAHDTNLLIGKSGTLPWHYPEDLKYFRETTLGAPVIMGRGVYEEIGEKPLTGRTNIVLSRSRTYADVITCKSVAEAIEIANSENEPEIFIIGGGDIYRQTIEMSDRMYITEIHKSYEGDTFFPEYRDNIGTDWIQVSRVDRDEISFVVYERASNVKKD